MGYLYRIKSIVIGEQILKGKKMKYGQSFETEEVDNEIRDAKDNRRVSIEILTETKKHRVEEKKQINLEEKGN